MEGTDPMRMFQGFGWTAWGAFMVLLGIIVRQVGPWRKQSHDSEKEFRDGLIKRVEKLERTLEVERALDRHRLNNVTQCLDALLLMLEAAPDKAAEIVARIKTMRSEQIQAEALEKAAIHAAVMAETGKPDD
jgi:hypothetical protein